MASRWQRRGSPGLAQLGSGLRGSKGSGLSRRPPEPRASLGARLADTAGRVRGCVACTWRGSGLGCKLCCRHLVSELLLSRSPAFSFCARPLNPATLLPRNVLSPSLSCCCSAFSGLPDHACLQLTGLPEAWRGLGPHMGRAANPRKENGDPAWAGGSHGEEGDHVGIMGSYVERRGPYRRPGLGSAGLSSEGQVVLAAGRKPWVAGGGQEAPGGRPRAAPWRAEGAW